MTRALWVGLLLMAGLDLPATSSFAFSSAECAGLSVSFKGPGHALAECESSKMGSGAGDTGTATSEYLQVVAGDTLFTLSHAYAGQRSYMIRLDVKSSLADISTFESTSNWGKERDSGDFFVRPFDAKFRANGEQAACVGYGLYSGHVAHTTGYRHHIAGFYCDFTRKPPTDAYIDELLGKIEYDF